MRPQTEGPTLHHGKAPALRGRGAGGEAFQHCATSGHLAKFWNVHWGGGMQRNQILECHWGVQCDQILERQWGKGSTTKCSSIPWGRMQRNQTLERLNWWRGESVGHLLGAPSTSSRIGRGHSVGRHLGATTSDLPTGGAPRGEGPVARLPGRRLPGREGPERRGISCAPIKALPPREGGAQGRRGVRMGGWGWVVCV